MTKNHKESRKQGINPTSGIIAGLLLLAVIIPAISSAALATTVSHPSIMFTDISEVPGYQYRSESPWNSWESSIISSADLSLSRDFSEPVWTRYDMIVYRAGYTRDLALAYHITGDERYADKAVEGLLNIGLGSQAAWSRATAVRDYGLAYDWIQPYLSEDDDRIIRNNYAELTDTAFCELNDYGNNRNYIAFADYHGRAYPNIGVAGLVLADFTNPDNLPLQSTPDDWRKAGTDYLFVNDELHSYNRPLIAFGFDEESGKNYAGSYKSYVIADLLWWFQIYSSYYDRNIFDDYPVSKKVVTSEIWETLPDGYMNNAVTSGNTLETYHGAILNLIDDTEKGVILDYLEKTEGKKILPYSAEYGKMAGIYMYLVYGNYDNIVKSPPSWTDHLNADATYQVFREGWEEDSDWLSLITFNGQTNSNRDTAHHDQLSIEYYGDGDLLLADGGENKYVLDRYYGPHAYLHNTIAIENPDSPYPVSDWADSESRGVFKGNVNGIATPVTVDHIVETPWMDILNAKETINYVVGSNSAYSQKLSSPIDYTRTIIHNDNDYFVIIDRFDGSEEWVYRNIFRPTSLGITPTKDLNGDRLYSESEAGHVNGDLEIGGTAYDWLSLPYKSETDSGIETNSVNWDTTNPYGNDVHLNIFSVPSSEVLITKHVGRIAGYSKESEVFSPTLYLKGQASEDLYRITALLSEYDYAGKKAAEVIAVNGNGNALRVTTPTAQDYFYSGDGVSAFDRFETDADIAYIRKYEGSNDFRLTIINGNYLNADGLSFAGLSGIDLATVNRAGNSVTVVTDSDSTGEFRLFQTGNNVTGVLKDGRAYSNWQFSDDNSALIINTDSGKHEYIVLMSGEALPVQTSPVAGFTVDVTEGEMPLEVHFTDKSINNPDTWLWNFGDGEVSEIQNPVHTYNATGRYTITLEVSNADGNDTEERTDYINVLAVPLVNEPEVGAKPEAVFSADVTEGEMPLEVHFTDASTNNPDTWSWNFGDGEVSEIQNPVHTYDAAGTYTITLEVSNADGSDAVEKTDYINVFTPPVVIEPETGDKLDADFTADVTTGAAPLKVQFTDASTGSPESWTYYFGDRGTSYDQNPVHTYTEPGTYYVMLRVARNGATELDLEKKFSYITVTDAVTYEPVLPVADFTSDVAEGEAGLEVHFNDTSINNPDTWSWSFGDGEVSEIQNPVHIYSDAGTYTVTLEVSNADGSDAVEKTDYINVLSPAPVQTPEPEPEVSDELNADFTADVTTGAAPLEVYFTDLSTGSPEGWTYYFGDGGTSYEQNPVHTYTEPGTYYVMLRVARNGATELDLEKKVGYITVTDEPDLNTDTEFILPVADFNSDTVEGEIGLEVHFTDASTNNPGAWLWSFGDGEVSGEENPVHVYSEAGLYTVTLEVSNADGTDLVEKSDYITIISPPAVTEPSEEAAPDADFIADVTSGSGSLEVHFTDMSTGTPDAWLWSFGDGEVSEKENPVHTYSEASTYTVTLEVSNAGGTDLVEKSDYITITSPPAVTEPSEEAALNADFIADVTYGSDPLEVHFTDKSTGTPDTWVYSFGDGHTAYGQNPVHVYDSPGVYTVYQQVTKNNGRERDYEKKVEYITVSDEPVEISKPPVAGFTSDVSEAESGIEIHFTDASTNYPNNWLWDFGNGEVSGEKNPVHAYSEAGTYTVTLEVSNADGTDTIKKVDYITVSLPEIIPEEEPEYVPMPPVADFTSDVVEAETGAVIQFTDTSTNSPDSWKWDFGNGDVSGEANPAYTYSEAGTYTVTLEVGNADGTDIAEKTDYIIILSPPAETEIPEDAVLDADFTADVTSGTAPLKVQFTDASTGTPDTWIYSFGDGRTAYERNPVHVYDSPGVYTVYQQVTKDNGHERDYEKKVEYIVVTAK